MSDEILEGKDQETLKTDEDKKILQGMRFRRIVDINMIRVFFLVLFFGMVISLIPALRPSYSDSEKRKLTAFPKPTVKTVLNGNFFDKIGLYFSDTFPFRDKFVEINGFLHGTFGHSEVEIHGKVEKGDEIPENIKKNDGTSSAAPSSSPADTKDDKTPSAPENTGPVVEQLGAIMIVDNSAYEYYNFVQSTADSYAAAVSRAGDMLGDKAKVYDIIVPTSMGITAPDNIVSGINTSDQKKSINYMYLKMAPSVSTVDVFDTLKAHKNEYIYFRTDHHWTARGAYYAYKELMNLKGSKAAPLDSFINLRFDGFLGSFYSQTGKSPRLAATPDYVEAFQPKQTNVMHAVKTTGPVDLPIVSDGNALGQSSKYLSFLRGDQPFATIVNPEITDNSVCIVVKESFGNAFVPFLTQNYGTVHIVDYRYISTVDGRKLSQLAADTGANDIIFINNISATRNKDLVGKIAEFVG